jgi:RNA polymerase sigma-70 factor (ECF subfamily)
VFVDIDDFTDVLPGEEAPEVTNGVDIEAHLKTLPQRQRDVLQSISVDGHSITETAKKFDMKEGAVRVALHRGLSTLAARARKDPI